MKIKTISLWQPHASLIALGEKPFETRSWWPNYRGLLAIHASKRVPVSADINHEFGDALRDVMHKHRIRPQTEWPLGCVVGVCELVHIYGTRGDGRSTASSGKVHLGKEWPDNATYAHLFGDFSLGRYAWLLAKVRRFKEPIPTKGRQGLWTLWDAPEEWESLLIRERRK